MPKTRFDEEAAIWDESPIRVERSKFLAEKLISLIRKNGFKKGMDFGAGTGLISFFLAGDLEEIIMVDDSEGMAEQMNKKLAVSDYKHLKAECIDLQITPIDDRFDIIYTLLTLHHIIDYRKMLGIFYSLLNPGGYICIADLDKEDGSFHAEYPEFDGHDGFDQGELKTILREIGFTEVDSEIYYTIQKDMPGGAKRDYPLFLMVGKKPFYK